MDPTTGTPAYVSLKHVNNLGGVGGVFENGSTPVEIAENFIQSPAFKALYQDSSPLSHWSVAGTQDLPNGATVVKMTQAYGGVLVEGGHLQVIVNQAANLVEGALARAPIIFGFSLTPTVSQAVAGTLYSVQDDSHWATFMNSEDRVDPVNAGQVMDAANCSVAQIVGVPYFNNTWGSEAASYQNGDRSYSISIPASNLPNSLEVDVRLTHGSFDAFRMKPVYQVFESDTNPDCEVAGVLSNSP